MFTGLIETVAKVKGNQKGQLSLERPGNFTDVKLGSSIAVSGVCLTVSAIDKSSMSFDVVPMTKKKSMLGTLKKGGCVNLERAMKGTNRFEGHVVMGHSEGIGAVLDMSDGILSILVPGELRRSIVRHGSIAIDGVSLTVAEVEETKITIALVPHTLKYTTLGSLKRGDSVNLETDILAKYPERALSGRE